MTENKTMIANTILKTQPLNTIVGLYLYGYLLYTTGYLQQSVHVKIELCPLQIIIIPIHQIIN